jgi:hypothetical protein
VQKEIKPTLLFTRNVDTKTDKNTVRFSSKTMNLEVIKSFSAVDEFKIM